MKVLFKFGTRVVQDMLEYPSGPGAIFVFEVETQRTIKTQKGAMWLLHLKKAKLLEALKEKGISCQWQVIKDRCRWIPTCYLERPITEVYTDAPFCPLPG